ncbi:hypothetical protein ASPCAL02348 [Aspergillus calidoustus]|uniref:Uncharacterized protein n=1 Tax=Aspergillus calidoustus TaxID=454130 RepID=A0A0U5GLF6_ASPCI|nr:hypothetical protein ASPCAL02348 [Aspergillus calidoustus]
MVATPFEGLTPQSPEPIRCIRDIVGDESVDIDILRFAGRPLPDSYSNERQPVGAMLAQQANNRIRTQIGVWQSVGMFAATPEEGAEELAKLSQGRHVVRRAIIPSRV